MNQTMSLAKKELKAYFGSPMAAIFIGAFLLTVLFSFFWVETFFARNIADIRPLFRWMPLLMIFLCAALTMRQWSEEQKMGTLEVLLTLPVRLSRLVSGKFLAVLALVGLALSLTLVLPLTVAMLGDIDWGVVLAGYLGAMLLAAAYIAIGLFVSSRTDNQIIALILTVLVSGFFYILGAANIVALVGNDAGELLRSLGTGSRFASIERGVIDLRDLVYYSSLTLFFLLMNGVSLESKRWSRGRQTARHRFNLKLALVLVALNLLALNIWLGSVHFLRLDLTENHEFSISQPTRDLIENLPEPLVLRGYFSEKTHPLLAPLVPRIRDFMEEYQVASSGRVKVDFVDPKHDEAAEIEANQQYGIKPVPFQVAGRYEASVINSYFNILIKYGDQHVTLGFNDLIEVRTRPDGQLEVGLRNLEYDLTKSIKKTVYGFQGLDTIFSRATQPMELTAVVTPDSLPPQLDGLVQTIKEMGEALAEEADGKLVFQLLDPDAPGAKLDRAEVDRRFQIQPLTAALFAKDTFYLHLVLTVGEQSERIYIGSEMGAAEMRREIEAVLKRTSSGFLKTVGIWTPAPASPMGGMQGMQGGQQYNFFQQVLRENYNLAQVDLKSGHVSAEVDVLLLVASQQLTDIERLAVDQYLMHGGSVVALAGSYVLDLAPGAQSLKLSELTEGLGELLSHYGVTVDKALVMDLQNEPFPVPVARDLGGFVIQEIKQLDYPFFVDVRPDGMAKDSPPVANLPTVTMNWVSPLTVDGDKTQGLAPVALLRSSPDSWLASDIDIQPDFDRFPARGFELGEERQSRTLAVALKGSLPSFFKGKADPRLAEGEHSDEGHDVQGAGSHDHSKELALSPLLEKSPDSSRLVVVGSSEFISDTVISIGQSMGQDRILNSLEFLQNLIDWSVEDEGLLAIRSRGTHARLLYPLSSREQAFWEWLNYGLALLALALVSWYGYRRRHRERPMPLDDVES
ncbi:MAG: Gldg family protein [Desulfobulbaceae bacterium]|nr:Gldg family protein [Desulfobulbaceae bacterium]HIJ78350.1 ABC transporter permease subunit [Deltaproteobacteria bacterium]